MQVSISCLIDVRAISWEVRIFYFEVRQQHGKHVQLLDVRIEII